MPLDLPPAQVERVVCSITAAIKYQVPANIMLAIAEQEGGRPGLENKNRNDNGSYDVGRMQFNTAYLKDLERYGITAEDVARPGCYSYDLAAWRIHGHIKNDSGDIWTRAANYHSRTPYYNSIYQSQITPKAAKWQRWLEERFDTYDATKPAEKPAQPQIQAVKATPEEKSLKNIEQVTELAKADGLPPQNTGSPALPSTPEQLAGFAASVQQIPVKAVSSADYQQRPERMPAQYNKAAAAALAAVYGNIKLR